MKKTEIQNRLKSLSQSLESFQKERDSAEEAPFELFQFPGCPSCSKVRLFLQQNQISFKKRDTVFEPPAKKELLLKTGRTELPSLKVNSKSGDPRWVFGADEIMAYLKKHQNWVSTVL